MIEPRFDPGQIEVFVYKQQVRLLCVLNGIAIATYDYVSRPRETPFTGNA